MKFRDFKLILNRSTEQINKSLQGWQGDAKVLQAAIENATRTLPNLRPDGKITLDTQYRDLASDCGYPCGNPSLYDYRLMYEQEAHANRAIALMPSECWGVYPEIFERDDPNKTTPFENRWNKLQDTVPCIHYLHRFDRMSRICEYGALLMGFGDKKDLSEPFVPPTSGTTELLYLRPFEQWNAPIYGFINDDKDPRYGQPEFYNLNFFDPTNLMTGGGGAAPQQIRKVHWTRVLHGADNRDGSDIFGIPEMRSYFRRLLDLRKLYAGSGEMYWKGALPGFSFEAYPDMAEDDEMDTESIQDQLLLYFSGLQRYMATVGGSMKSLAPQVSDPTHHIAVQLAIICAKIGCPLSIFLGNQSGQLASTENAEVWNKHVSERQRLYCEPMILRPFLDRLIWAKVLPTPRKKYQVSWEDLNTISQTDKADVALKRAQTLLQYLSSGAEKAVPLPFAYTTLFGYTDDERDDILAMVLDMAANPAKYLTKDLWTATAAMEGLKLKQQKQKTGNEAIRSPLGKTKAKPARAPKKN